MEKGIMALALITVGTLTAAFMLAAALLHSNEEINQENFDLWKRKELENNK